MMKILAKKYASRLACPSPMFPLEVRFRGHARGPDLLRTNSGQKNQFAGFTTLNSGTAFVTISTAMVKSGDIIHTSFQVQTTAASGTGYMVGVSSLVNNVSFALGYLDGQGRSPGGIVSWEIRRTS